MLLRPYSTVVTMASCSLEGCGFEPRPGRSFFRVLRINPCGHTGVVRERKKFGRSRVRYRVWTDPISRSEEGNFLDLSSVQPEWPIAPSGRRPWDQVRSVVGVAPNKYSEMIGAFIGLNLGTEDLRGRDRRYRPRNVVPWEAHFFHSNSSVEFRWGKP